MNFLISIAIVWVFIMALFYPGEDNLNLTGKWIRNVMVFIVVSFTILMSYQMGRIEGHYESYNYIYKNGDIPPGSVYNAIWHDRNDVSPL